MKKLHAAGAAVVGVALSATAALAAAPLLTGAPENAPADNHGAVVSTVAQDETQVGGENDNHGGAVSTVARGTHGPDADAEATGADATDAEEVAPTDNHGAVVSAVAKDKTQVGGKNNNHGGAVSEAAHGDHGPNEHANGHANDHD